MKKRIKVSELRKMMKEMQQDIIYVILQINGYRTILLDEFDTRAEAEDNLEYYKDRVGPGGKIKIEEIDKNSEHDMKIYNNFE